MRITIGVKSAALLALCALCAPSAARADQRSFVRSYEFQTQPKGNLELEIWNDVEPPKGAFSDAVITHRLELEYGVTDRWDAALYHVFAQGGPAGADDRGFHFDGWRLESRYRLAERGEWPIDVMLYLEAERPANFDNPWEAEGKLILQRDFGRLALVANFVAETKLARGPRGGHNWEVDLGVRYELAPWIRVAGEVWGIQQVEGGTGDTTTAYYAGPSVMLAAKKFWIQLGAGVGLTDTASAMQLRSVIGFNL